MKAAEKKQAIHLRKNGMAIGEIAKKLQVSKGSVSIWVRDVKLTPGQRSKLNKNGHSVEAIEKRRISRLENVQAKREKIKAAARKQARSLIKNPLWCVAVSMYWGEGGKTQNITRIANSDPAVIRLMMLFFRKVCGIPEEKFHGHVHTFSHCDEEKAEKYWSNVSGIPKKQFFKTYKKQSSASKKKKDTLPKGTLQVYVHDTNFFFTMMAWIEYLRESDFKNIQ